LCLDLFWSHIRDRPDWNLRAHGRGTVSSRSNAKITEQDIIVSPDEHIFWLDIAMNVLLIVGILQSLCDLLDIGHNGREGNVLAFGVPFPQRAIRTVVHHQEGDTIGDIKVEDAHNVGMHKLGNCLSLLLKPIDLFV
jgi:hypothetical protein